MAYQSGGELFLADIASGIFQSAGEFFLRGHLVQQSQMQ